MQNLHAIRRGRLLEDVNESLRSVVKMVMESGRAGSVTLKLSLKPVSRNEDQIQVSDTITVTPPKPEPGSTILWAGENGELHRNAPDADDTPLREVAG